jgi:hypothetical protein
MSDVRVLLCTLSIRTSKAGRSYMSGWLGKSNLVGWAGEPDRFGQRTIDLFLVPGKARREQPHREVATIDGQANG